MEIAKVETYPMIHKLREYYGDANGYKKYRTSYLIKITTIDGVEGWGESVDWLPTLEKGFIERIVPYLIGKQANHRTKLCQHISKWNQRAAVGVSMALTEIIAKYANLSICDLWGGSLRERVPVYASFQSYSTSEEWQANSLHHIESAITTGYKQIKVKIGGRRVQEDIEHIHKIFSSISKDVQVAIDANQSYDLSTTKQFLHHFEDVENIMWLEEPMPLDSVMDYKWLRSYAKVPIAGGENLQGITKFLPLMKECGIDIVQPDVMHHSDIESFRQMLSAARGFGLKASPHAFDGILSRYYAILAQACLASWSKMKDEDIEPVEWDMMENPFNDILPIRPLNGFVSIPEGLGLGIGLDVEKINFYKWDGSSYE